MKIYVPCPIDSKRALKEKYKAKENVLFLFVLDCQIVWMIFKNIAFDLNRIIIIIIQTKKFKRSVEDKSTCM